jgi:hypothetical protein
MQPQPPISPRQPGQLWPDAGLGPVPSRGAAGSSRPSSATVETREALVSRLTGAFLRGVSDGARTRDTQDHNLVLYQLSYTHHVSWTHRPSAGRPRSRHHDTGDPQAPDAAGGPCGGTPASSAANSSAKDAVTVAAAACAWDVEGPGPSTNSVRR